MTRCVTPRAPVNSPVLPEQVGEEVGDVVAEGREGISDRRNRGATEPEARQQVADRFDGLVEGVRQDGVDLRRRRTDRLEDRCRSVRGLLEDALQDGPDLRDPIAVRTQLPRRLFGSLVV